MAERLGKALLGKSAMPYDHPLCTGSLGLLGTKASWDLMQACVTLLIGGSDTEFLPEPGQARGVQSTTVRGCSVCANRPRSICFAMRRLMPIWQVWSTKLIAEEHAWICNIRLRSYIDCACGAVPL